MPASIQNLSAYLRTLKCRRADENENTEAFPWNESQILSVFHYVTKFSSNSEHETLCDKIRALDDLASYFIFDSETEDLNKFSEMVASLMPELHKFFIVPKLSDSKNEVLLAGFISFLLQILDSETDFINLQQELKFMLTILGDMTPMNSNLVDEFEAVANEAAKFIFSCFFAMDRSIGSRMKMGFQDLMGKIEFLRSESKDHCIKFSNSITPRTCADSLFIVDSLLDDLEDLMNGNVDLIDDLKDRITTLYNELKVWWSIKVKEPMEIEESKQIRDLAYAAEYLVSSFMLGDIPVWYLTLRLSDVIKKINLVRTRIDEIVEKNDDNIGATTSVQDRSSPVVDSIVVGFKNDAKEILDLLTGGPESLQIISILGVPGIGKTTLAKMLYEDPLVVSHFDVHGWGDVPQKYHGTNVLLNVLTSLRRKKLDRAKISSLGYMVRQCLKPKRYLVVLDDIRDPIVWDDLRRFFPDEKNGSRILFTSRVKTVAPSGSIIHTIPFLSHDQCWDLLKSNVFKGDPCPEFLMDVGMRIAALCNRLPLAVVIIAGILANMDKEETRWRKVEQSLEIFSKDPQNLMKILGLGYELLPDHLKPCFLYFGAFSEETEIPTWKLTSLWIAEGFVHKEDERSLESVAEEYLMELIDRGLVMVSRRRYDCEVKACSIHDLTLEVCLRKAEDGNFLKLVEDSKSIYEQHHRLCTSPSSSPSFCKPFSLHLRAYLGHLPDPFFCLPAMKRVRILDLSTRTLDKYEQEKIGSLVNLRYLSLGCIPSSINNFQKLEFLCVESISLVTIPSALLQILKLRYLHIKPQAKFDQNCILISQENNLHTLFIVRIYDFEDEEILKCSPHLRKLKCVCRPLSFDKVEGAQRYPDLSFLKQLESLKMDVQSSFKSERMAFINFPTSIKKLSLSGTRLSWEEMSVIGQLPNLEVLKLASFAFEGQCWKTRNGEFKELRVLKLNRLMLSQWDVASSEHFPRLGRLVLRNCYIRETIPCALGDVATLRTIEVHSCSVYVSDFAKKVEQLRYGNEKLKVIISGDMW